MSSYYKGFTLAEILITLVVIGVVAALVIPSVTHDIQNYQYKVAWKKAYSDLDQVTARVRQANGGTLKGLCNDSDYDCLVKKFLPYLSATKSGSYMTFLGFIDLTNGVSITFQDYTKNCTYGNTCAMFLIDLPNGPDLVGVDQFGGYIMKDRVIPFGSVLDPQYNDATYPTNPAVNCDPKYLNATQANNKGQVGCSAKYLME